MVEVIGVVVITALILVLAWAMGAERSEAELRARFGLQQVAEGENRSTQPVRHAA